MITVYSYAIEILTTNRTDSLQYNGANSRLQSMSALRGLELGTSRSLCQCVIQCAIGPRTYVGVKWVLYLHSFSELKGKHANVSWC